MADYQKTVALLKRSKASYSTIEDDLGITKDQLTRFANFKIVHPCPNMVDCLHDYLVREEKHRLRQARKCAYIESA